MDDYEIRWQCINKCNTFTVPTTPSFCPFCGASEVHPAEDGIESYDVPDTMIINDGEGPVK